MAKFLPPSKNTKMYAGGTSGFNELTGQPAQTGGMFTEDSFATPGFGTNPFEQPEFGEIVEEDNLTERLMSMLGGIGQAELGSIWADPSVQQILTANSIRMTPDAPWNEQIGTLSPEALEQLITAIQGIDSGEIVVDPNQDTLPGDTTGGDTTTGGGEEGEQEEQEGWLDRLSNWWDSVVSSVGSGASGSTPPTLPGSSGVIISPGSAGMSWPDIIANPGAWQVYLPGVIPGLPQSPTIIGTIEDILSSPGEVLGDLWDQIENTVANPGEFLEDLLNGVVDEDGLITIGGISTVVGTIYDDLFGDDDDTATAPGGAEEEEEDERQGEIIVESSDTKGGSQMGTAPVMDPIQPQPQPEIGGSGDGPIKGDPIKQTPLQPDPVEGDLPLTGDGPIKGDPIRQAPISDEPQPELGGAGNVVDSVSAGGGGGGMMRRGQPHFGGIPYGLPQGEMILYRPPTANEILTDFTNGLAMQRKRGMLV